MISIDENSVLLDGMGLRLYVFYLIEPNGSDVRKRALLRAFSLAIGMVHKFAAVAERPNFTEYAPQVFFQIASLGAMLILKITYSNYSAYIDCEEGERMFHVATQLVRRMSLEDNDLPGRMSKILTQLWSAYALVGAINEEPTLKLRTRLSASLLHDLLWCWRETFGGQGGQSNGSIAPNAPDTAIDPSSFGKSYVTKFLSNGKYRWA
jgi:transcriptional regulatory protein LEU3